ncbi:hypothetical protein CTT31_11480 [Pseudoalteromonas maricaloris]|uniref:hypothetical protein n=1 Tax=Pseudoalteromonas maricaloris TaxID=184924 RepID=UPI0021AE2463|nr:hypothetical protein [Pseudoalteromonas flavipulchra]USE69709.1 hypothetical protein CTT31_11480 [Pseudoalteromonas flavipulchra]
MKYKKKMKAKDVGIVDNDVYKFTWRQHFLPYSSMRRFSGENERLYVVNKLNLKVNFRKLDRYEPGAVVARAWTQKAEKQFFPRIETSFFDLSERICNGQDNLTHTDHQTLTNYISLWDARFRFRINDMKKESLNGIPDPQLTQHQVQNLEQIGASGGGVVRAHESNSFQVQRMYDYSRAMLKNIEWQVYRLIILDCILPDTINRQLIIPIAPNVVVLPKGSDLDIMSKESVSSLNLKLISGCEEYYYARDISRIIYC